MTWEICRILTRVLKNLKYLHFNWLLWPKYIMFELKKFKELIFNGTEYWCKIWMKADLCSQECYEDFEKFSLTHSKVSELRLSMDPLAQSRKWVSLKFKGGLCVITMNNDAKFREELSCQFKMSHEEFNDFDRSSQKSQKYSL